MEKDDHIKHFELVGVPLKKQQLELMNYHITYDDIPEIDDREFETISNKIAPMEPVDYDPQEDQSITRSSISDSRNQKAKPDLKLIL